MAVLNHKIDFVALVSVTKANSNGDPLNCENRDSVPPRTGRAD